MFQREIKIHEQQQQNFGEVINGKACIILSPVAKFHRCEPDLIIKHRRDGGVF
jgi:hypothetical protein